MKKLIEKICEYFARLLDEVGQIDACIRAMREPHGEDEEAVSGIKMTKPNEVPNIAIGSGKFEDGSTCVVINYIEGGTSRKCGERIGDDECKLVPIYVMQFFQEGSIDSLITHAQWAKEHLDYKREESK